MSSSIAKFKDYDQEELHDQNFIKLLLIILFDHLGRRINDEKLESITNYFVEMWNSFANIKEDFRILCLAQNPKDILMWGYYGNGGTGVCNTYNSIILKQDIENSFKNEICIYDLVTYSSDDTLPSISSKNKDLQDNIFQYIADCVFTKYKAWSHEEEFRFVLIDNDFEEDYLAMQTTVKNHYFGCKYESVDYYHNHGYDTKYKINSLKLCKHKNRYELVEEKFKRGH